MTSIHLDRQHLNLKNRRNYFLYWATFAVNLSSFALGSALTWSSPALIKLNEEGSPLREKLTPSQQSWLASLLPLGAAVSPPLAGLLCGKIGRKKTLIIFDVPMVVGYVMKALSTELYQFYIGRFLCGISTGGLMTVAPLYVGEIAENHNRGTLGCFLPLIMNIGGIFSFAVGPYVSLITLGLTSAICPFLFLIIFTFFIPESPYYFLLRNDGKAARASFRKLRTYYESEESEEFLEIKETVKKTSESESIRLNNLLNNKAIVKSIFITLSLFILQQFSGIGVILVYAQSIFQATGSAISPEISSVVIVIVQLLGCLLATLVIDRIGRRMLLLLSSFGNASALFTLALVFFLQSKDVRIEAFQWLPTASLIMFMISYSIGMGPLPIAIVGEIFPSNIKSAASTLAIAVSLLSCFCTAKFFPSLILHIGMAASFWMFSAICLIGCLFVYLNVPETKGKSFQEIQDMLNS